METHQPGALVLGPEPLLHHLIPDLARRPVFRDLLEEIVVRVEKEAEPRTKFVYVKAAPACPFDIFDAIIKCESQLLQRSRSGFANVISADRDCVKAWRELRSEFECVDYQTHRRRWRIDVFLLRYVFLENVVLHGSGNLFPVRALLFCHDQIHGPQHRSGRVDSHRNRGALETDPAEKNLHILERINGHAALADLALARWMIGV